MLELKVSSKKYNAELYLERRITYIRGESGTGKTSLIYMIEQFKREVSGINVECNLKLRVMGELPELEELSVVRDSVLFFDDELCSELDMGVFSRLCPKNNLYVVVINRVDSIESGKFPKLDFAVSSILVSKQDGINHYFVPISSLDVGGNWGTCRVDIVLTEDTYGLCNMEELLGVRCVSSNGKDNIINALDKLCKQGYRNVLVCADWSAFGRNFSNFYGYCLESSINVLADFNYECFEYMLLVSNMLKDKFTFNEDDANKYPSWERYFEVSLESITKGKFYKYVHGKEVRDCYTKDCLDSSCNKYIKNICDGYSSCSKLDILFKDTIFDYMRTL